MAAKPGQPLSAGSTHPSIMLWSAGNRLKSFINHTYYGYHYIWCASVFEGAAQARGALGSMQASSSDPASIYRRLFQDVSTMDRNSNEISRQRDVMIGTALFLYTSGIIDKRTADTVSAIINKAGIEDFRPVLYAVPLSIVSSRLQYVPVDKWAGLEQEYIIPDLKDGEFHMIEPMPCR